MSHKKSIKHKPTLTQLKCFERKSFIKKIISIFVLILVLHTTDYIIHFAHAGPASSTYELKQYGFGGGGTVDSTSTNYGVFGIIGEQEGDQLSGTTYKANSGLTFSVQSNVPPAPTFTNVDNNYDRLKIVIGIGGNPTDAKFAVAISTDDFVTTQWVQGDFTIGSTLGTEDWLTYAGWGSASGQTITGLKDSTTYKVKVTAKHGKYTQSPLGPLASASTVSPTLTFGIDSASITFDNLYSGNSFTDSSKTTTLTTSTNAYNGYIVYGRVTAPLTKGAHTIANYASTNASPSTWSGNGFGYTTDDSSLTGGTANRFTSGGPKYAGFGTSSPGDPVADHPGPIISPISSEQFTISYRVTTSETQQAGTYTTTVLYVVVPTY